MNNYKVLWFVMFFFVIKTGYAQLATGSWDKNYSALYFNTDNSTPNCMIVAYKPNSILSFRTLNIDRMWLTSTGNFGIGVSTPSSLLHVQSAVAGQIGNDYKIANFTASTGDFFRFGTGYWNPNNLEINAFALSGTKSLVLQGDVNAGNVGVGSFSSTGFHTSPTAKLHVFSGGTNSAIFEYKMNETSVFFPRIAITHYNTMDTKNMIDGSTYNSTTGTSVAAPILFQNNSGGNIGIGTWGSPVNTTIQDFTPVSKLQIQGGAFQITNSGDPTVLTSGKTGLLMGHYGNKSTTSTNSYSWIQSSNGPLLLNPYAGNSFTTTNTNNYVAIGFLPTATDLTTLPANGYNLLVQGKIACEELKVKLKVSGTAWPDYVFAKNYRLMSIDSLSTYIDHNCHLPDVPTTAEVEENGIMTGEMNAILLKKVEELTLYMIEQNKTSSTQAEQIELLKKQNELLMEQVQLLVQNNK
jgi:hypothetical protein